MGHRITYVLAIILIGSGLIADRSLADPPGLKPLAIGADAPDFSLPGIDGKTYTLKSFAESKALVVVFTCNPVATTQAAKGRFVE